MKLDELYSGIECCDGCLQASSGSNFVSMLGTQIGCVLILLSNKHRLKSAKLKVRVENSIIATFKVNQRLKTLEFVKKSIGNCVLSVYEHLPVWIHMCTSPYII